MRISIITEDNAVVINGKHMVSDCSGLLADNIRAVQWYDKHGEVEFINHVAPNEIIKDLSPFQQYIDTATEPLAPEPMSPEEHAAFQKKWMEEHPEFAKQMEKLVFTPGNDN